MVEKSAACSQFFLAEMCLSLYDKVRGTRPPARRCGASRARNYHRQKIDVPFVKRRRSLVCGSRTRLLRGYKLDYYRDLRGAPRIG